MLTIVKQTLETGVGGRRHSWEGRNARITRFFGGEVVLLGLVLLFLGGCAAPERKPTRPSKIQLPESKIVESFRISAADPQGIAAVSGSIWLLDARGQKLLEIDPKSGTRVSSVRVTVESPRGLAWDGKHFWCGDNKTKTVCLLDTATGKVLRSLKVPIDGKAEAAVLENIVFDREQLWVAYAAGYSSRILRIDALTGEIVQSMFADCHPRGITTDGKRLWVVCYNGGLRPSVLSVRTIMDDPGKMNASRVFLSTTPGLEPTGIAFDGQFLWLTDKKLKVLQKVVTPSPN
jgi:DNA-binding beta-propeller fold protein YncE